MDTPVPSAFGERINGILKGEFLLQRPADLAQARKMVDESVAIYNPERPHCSLQLKTPNEVHRASQAELLQHKHPETTGVNL